jgi:hypothetical protein
MERTGTSAGPDTGNSHAGRRAYSRSARTRGGGKEVALALQAAVRGTR